MKQIIFLLLIASNCFAQSSQPQGTVSALTLKSDGTLGWQVGNRTQYIRGDGSLDTRVIYVSGVASSILTGTTSETNMLNILVPDSALNPNSMIRITLLWKFVGTAGTRLPVLRIDTVSGGITGTAITASNVLGATTLTGYTNVNIWNANSYTSQIFGIAFTFTGGTVAVSTSSINTARHFYIKAGLQLANSGDSGQIVGGTVEIINP